MKSPDNVLLVEDEKDTRFILEKLLSKNNFVVETATNGVEALEKLKTFSPKVILADWTMPVMDGMKLCSIIKNDPNYKMIYFIILTARTSLNDKVAGLDIGADDFLVKPIENQELIARIRSGVRIYDLQNEVKVAEHSKALIEMACTIGHNLNNPLSSLEMAFENLKSELSEESKQKFDDDFNLIKLSIDRIKTLASQLVNIQDPKLIEYTGGTKMIRLD
ncbi:MAG: response regulator [Ignavibacterium sp.]|nr:response regulator [Ignavibacterium sp.]MCX7610588.1 response regulator [Ignavibacterium sp.]MDW8374164.1 response regulator [Ignavibacteriales bacterium]